MSPAGYWPQLHAAIEAGADAVYFGLKHFTARAKVGFSLSELPEVMRTLHQRGVRGFVTFNTLVFEHELTEAAHTIGEIAEAQADALIIQDLGILRLAREIAPNLELHASTQMSVTNAAGIRLAQSYGADRVTLARELSLLEIRKIIEETAAEVEVFVHGALCVAYSGQCLSSEAWGGRSANRGQCAQACRLPYEMWVDGRKRPLGDARYLLSPGDLYALDQVPDLVDAGVATLKIEGRYKGEEYVALTTRAYRKAVDEAWAGRPLEPDPAERLRLEQVYSRGLGPWFMAGTNHQTVVQGRAPRHRGVEVGHVTRVAEDSVWIEPRPAVAISPPKPGHGIVFDAASWRSPEEPEEGGRIYQVLPALDGSLELRFGNNTVDFTRVRRGDLVWRTHDPDLDRVVKPYLEPANPVARQDLDVHLVAREGHRLQATFRAGPRTSITVESSTALAASTHLPITEELVRDHLARLGNTPYRLHGLTLETEGSPFVPASLLNQLRRDAVLALQELQGAARSAEVRSPAASLSKMLPGAASRETREHAKPQLHLLVRTPEQLDSAIAARPASITLDYLDLYGLRPSVERVKSESIAVRVASPRVLKPGEERILNFLASLQCGILVRAAGMIQPLRASTNPETELTGDFSLNAANTIATATYLNLGLNRVTPSHDLNAQQIAGLARAIGGERIEAVVYQHLPVFHTEHCVFCRFLSTGTSYRDCGRPCEQHRVALKDHTGRAHPVMADVGCRNTVFGAEAQHASVHMEEFGDVGVRHLRIEFVHESATQVSGVTEAFARAMSGSFTAARLSEELRKHAPSGITEGSLFVPNDYLALPVLQ